MFARTGEITAPCGVPRSTSSRRPSSSTPAFSHLPIRRTSRLSAIRCSRNRTSHSQLTELKNARTSASSSPVHPLPIDRGRQRIQRLMLGYAAAGTHRKSRGSPSRRWRSGFPPPPAGRSCPPARRCPEWPLLGCPVRECTDVATASPDKHPVVRVRTGPRDCSPDPFRTDPSDAVDAGHRSPLQLVERPAEQVDGHVVKECRERTCLSRLAVSRMRSSAGDTLSQLCVWHLITHEPQPV